VNGAVTHRTAGRLDVREFPRSSTATFAQDVAATLGRTPKRLIPPKYFYDDLGSALFDAITQLPAYYLNRAEIEILTDASREIIRTFGSPLELLELGSGSAIKTPLLIDEILRTQETLRFNAIEVSRATLEESALALLDAYPTLLVRAFVGDYFDVLRSGVLRSAPRLKTLALCLGSHIGNYDPEETQYLMSLLSETLRSGDGVLLSTDLKKDASKLEGAYHDQGGVMEAFGKNLLIRMNRELGANFDPSDFDLVVHYDEAAGSVDSFLRAKRDHVVTIPGGELTLHFTSGELVLTERSRKFELNDVAVLAAMNAFTVVRSWHDRQRTFATHLLVRT
jgi:L-histidine N-alpha-methyltransferase